MPPKALPQSVILIAAAAFAAGIGSGWLSTGPDPGSRSLRCEQHEASPPTPAPSPAVVACTAIDDSAIERAVEEAIMKAINSPLFAERVRSNNEHSDAVVPVLPLPPPATLPTPPPLSPSVSQQQSLPVLSTGAYFISPLLRAAGGLAKKAVVSGVSYMASVAHPRYNAVLDAGAFDGSDYTLPAFRAGYSVFSFEMAPENQNRVVATLNSAGLREGADFTIIRPTPGAKPSPPPRAAAQAHVYLFFAGVSSSNSGVKVGYNSIMSGAGEGIEVAGPCSHTGDASCLPVVRIDDVVPEWAKLWIFKLDVQGHEPQALAGATALLASRRVHSLMMEWWPAGMVLQGTADGGVAALNALYALGAQCFDVGTSEGNQMPGTGIDHATSVPAWTAAMLAVPHRTPPGGDPIGAWDDLMCTMPL